MSGYGVIIMGPPASGKGTQAEKIREEFNLVHLSTGAMLRAAVEAGSEVGKSAKEQMASGKPVPDELMIKLVLERLGEKDCKEKGWLLDGFPCTVAQATALSKAGIKPKSVVFLNLSDELVIKRIGGRRVDKETKLTYHLDFNPPPDDVPEDRLEKRADDTEERVKVRLEAFHSNFEGVRKAYEMVLCKVDARQKPETIWKAIKMSMPEKAEEKTINPELRDNLGKGKAIAAGGMVQMIRGALDEVERACVLSPLKLVDYDRMKSSSNLPDLDDGPDGFPEESQSWHLDGTAIRAALKELRKP